MIKTRNANTTLRINSAKKLTFDTLTANTYLSSIIEVGPIPNLSIGLISSEEKTQQTNQKISSVSQSESNLKNTIIKHLDKDIKELSDKHLSLFEMEYESNLAKPETTMATKNSSTFS